MHNNSGAELVFQKYYKLLEKSCFFKLYTARDIGESKILNVLYMSTLIRIIYF